MLKLALLRYTVMRLALFVAALALAGWAGAGPLTAVLIAAVVSSAVAYLFLRGPRDQVANAVAEKVERRLERPGRFRQGLADDARAEDAQVDQQR